MPQRNVFSLPGGEIRAAGGRGGQSQAEGGEEEEKEKAVQESEEGQCELFMLSSWNHRNHLEDCLKFWTHSKIHL